MYPCPTKATAATDDPSKALEESHNPLSTQENP